MWKLLGLTGVVEMILWALPWEDTPMHRMEDSAILAMATVLISVSLAGILIERGQR